MTKDVWIVVGYGSHNPIVKGAFDNRKDALKLARNVNSRAHFWRYQVVKTTLFTENP